MYSGLECGAPLGSRCVGQEVMQMHLMKQIFAVAELSVRSLPRRGASSLVVVIGVAAVVAVLISVLAMARGLSQTLANAGHDSRAIVVRKGADTEGASVLERVVEDVVESA